MRSEPLAKRIRTQGKSIGRGALAIAMVLASLMGASMQKAAAEDIWFGTNFKYRDFMELFSPNAPWSLAASRIRAIEFATEVALRFDEPKLREILDGVKRRNLDLVFGLGPLSGPGPNRCGVRVEGYSAPGEPLAVAQRLKSLGAEPAYFSFDEPLYYGHVFGRPGEHSGCHAPIAEIAHDVAQKVRAVRTVLPNVKFGDVEPITGFNDSTWLTDLETWFDAYQRETGEPLAFFRIDVAWKDNWMGRMGPLSTLLHRKGIPLQVIYDGDGNETSDAAAIANMVNNFKRFESASWPVPDVAMIQFWTPHPSRNLPESDSTTITAAINQYYDWAKSRGRR